MAKGQIPPQFAAAIQRRMANNGPNPPKKKGGLPPGLAAFQAKRKASGPPASAKTAIPKVKPSPGTSSPPGFSKGGSIAF
jgi:hypothetical protein